jgi:hypothetical protein
MVESEVSPGILPHGATSKRYSSTTSTVVALPGTVQANWKRSTVLVQYYCCTVGTGTPRSTGAILLIQYFNTVLPD